MTVALILFFWMVFRRTATWSFSFDGLSYMLDVEFGGPRNLLHPFHMAYSLLGRGLYQIALHAGYHGRAIFFMQAVNAILGAVALGVFYRTARSRFDPLPSTIAALALGFSFAFWTEIVDPGCYALAALATCLLLALVMENPQKFFWTGLAHGLAVLVHLMLVLAVPAFLWSFYKRGASSRKAIARYLLGLLLTTGLAYGGMAIALGSFRDFMSWFLEPAWKPQTNFLTQNYLHWNWAKNLLMSWHVFANSLMRLDPSAPRWEGIVWTMAVLVFFATVISGSVWNFRRKNKDDRTLLLWIWVLGLSSLQFFYAADTRFRILWLPAFFLLALESGRAPFLRAVWRWVGWLVPLVAWVNFHGTFHPQSQPERNPSLLRALWVNHHVRPDEFLLFWGREPESMVNFYAAYFAHDVTARSIQGFYFNHAGEGLRPLDDLIRTQETQGHKLVFEELFWDAKQQQQIADTIHVPVTDVSRWLAPWRPVERRAAPDGYRLVTVVRQAR